MTGKITRLAYDRGFGFIAADDGQEYFLLYRHLVDADLRDLSAGDALEFEPATTPKGLRAINVRAAVATRAGELKAEG